jgi:predicted Rossmann fold nucleotide-binding protein DprA/Smf involved in DNA uptake
MSEATIVIESADRGGSLIGSKYGQWLQPWCICSPGRVTDKYSQGCNNLIKPKKQMYWPVPRIWFIFLGTGINNNLVHDDEQKYTITP